jgi:hypothetical protein
MFDVLCISYKHTSHFIFLSKKASLLAARAVPVLLSTATSWSLVISNYQYWANILDSCDLRTHFEATSISSRVFQSVS